MSLDAMVWAVKDAPVADVQERAILVAMADMADEAGCGSWLSQKTIAVQCLIDRKTVQRRIDALEDRGLIARGNQALAAYIPAEFRPVVWDLRIPFQWFPNINRTNAALVARGLKPLSEESRPPLPPAPPRPRRADAKSASDAQGLQVPPGEEGGDYQSPGDSQSEGWGLVVPEVGTTSPPTQSITQLLNPEYSNASGVASAEDLDGSVQLTLDGQATPPLTATQLARQQKQTAYAIGARWLKQEQFVLAPPTMRQPLHALGKILTAALAAGYHEAEIEVALKDCNVAVPSSALLQRLLRQHRLGRSVEHPRGTKDLQVNAAWGQADTEVAW